MVPLGELRGAVYVLERVVSGPVYLYTDSAYVMDSHLKGEDYTSTLACGPLWQRFWAAYHKLDDNVGDAHSDGEERFG